MCFQGLLIPLILLLVAACGPLPRPFSPEGKEEVNLAALEQGVELLVLPLESGPGSELSDPYGAAFQLAQALRGLGIQAAADAPAADRILRGRAQVEENADGRELVRIDWQIAGAGGPGAGGSSLLGAGGAPISFEQASSLPKGLWRKGQPTAIGSVMAQAAQLVATHLRDGSGQAAAAVPLSRVSKPRLVLLPLDLLPGDGNLTLPRALEQALLAEEFEVGWDIGEDDLLVMGDLAVTPDGGGMEKIAVTWWVVRASDSQDLGKVEQENRVPTGSLDGRWGPLAQAIAQGAAEGISGIVKRRWRQ